MRSRHTERVAGTHARSSPPAGGARALLGTAAAALLVASVVAATVAGLGRSPAHRPVHRPGRGTPPSQTAEPANSEVPLPTCLTGRLLAPEDFGGYYRPAPATAPADLNSSRCLRAIAGAGHPAEQASTYLAVGNAGGVPAVLEAVDVHRTPAAAAAGWSAAAKSLRHCLTLRADLAGEGRITTRLAAVPPATLGLQEVGRHVELRRGTFEASGLLESLEIAVVSAGNRLLVVAELDRVPPVPGSAIYDNFGSAVVTAYGKLA